MRVGGPGRCVDARGDSTRTEAAETATWVINHAETEDTKRLWRASLVSGEQGNDQPAITKSRVGRRKAGARRGVARYVTGQER